MSAQLAHTVLLVASPPVQRENTTLFTSKMQTPVWTALLERIVMW